MEVDFETGAAVKRRPLDDFYKGHGGAVMRDMVASNKGDRQAAEREFFSTVNKMREGTKKQKGAQPKRAPGVKPK